MRTAWASEELDILRECDTVTEARKRLPHRSRSSIYRKKQYLLSGVNVHTMWTPEEDDILYEHGMMYTGIKLNELYLPDRTPSAINTRRRTLGIKIDRERRPYKDSDWTKEEDELLLKYGPIYSHTILHEKYITTRTASAISQRRIKLGIIPNADRIGIDGRVGWTPEEDDALKQGMLDPGNYNYQEINEKFLPHRTLSAVMSRAGKHLGLRRTPEAAYAIHQRACSTTKNDHAITLNDLSNTTYQILIGSILGDACIPVEKRRTRRTYKYAEGHALDQEDYMLWKADMLSEFKTRIHGVKTKYDERQDKTYYSRCFTAPSSGVFKTIRKDFYARRPSGVWGKILLPEQWLNKLDLLGLLIWYLDDGSSSLGRSRIEGKTGNCFTSTSIHVNSFSHEDLSRVLEDLNNRFGLDMYINESRGKYFKRVITIPATSRKILFPIWKDYFKAYNIPDCMLYKVSISAAKAKKGST